MENKDWEKEKADIIERLSKYIDLTVYPAGKDKRGVLDIEKRDPMYGGDGVVYMVSFFEKDELINNRISLYMVLMNKGDQAGFHDHASRKEQEVYVIVSGEAKYEEKKGKEGEPRVMHLKKGNIVTVQGEYFHSVTNTGDEPLIIFVITTYEPS